MPTPAATRSNRCSTSPACRHRRWRLARLACALFDDEAGATEARRRARRRPPASATCTSCDRRRRRAGLGASHAGAVRPLPVRRLLDRADLERNRRRSAAGDPARPGPRVRHRHASDDAHVLALDRHPGRRRRRWPRALDYGCGSGVLAIAAGRSAHAKSMRSTSIRRRSRRRARTRSPTASPCAPARPKTAPGPTRWSSPTSSPRRSSCSRRCCRRLSRRRRPGPGRHPRSPDRRAARRLRAVDRAEVGDADDGWILMTSATRARRVAHGMIRR